MKKLLPIAVTALLATACAQDQNGNWRWGHCDHCYSGHPMEALSDRSFGSSRGWDNQPIEYNDTDYRDIHNTDYGHSKQAEMDHANHVHHHQVNSDGTVTTTY